MAESRPCPQCGEELPADAPMGLCPQCVLNLAAQTQQVTQAAAGRSEGQASAQPPFVPPAPEELAASFPQLEVLELLGQGGMGAVYKARQPTLDRLVALKILPPSLGADPAFAERFAREARSLARLNHPNIVGIYDFGQAGGLYYFVMEYVDGVNLRQMEGRQPLAAKDALAIVPQICDALQYAHDEGIVHRDIKPENILIDKKGRVKIADFGLAKLLARTPADYTLTRPRQVMGTVHYMAPEQIECSTTVDQRADIYSLGVVFYEMLTGELPLGRFDPPSRKVQIDVRLDEVVLKTLEKEPDRRYQQVSQVGTDVESITSASPAGTFPSGRSGPHARVPVGDPDGREALASAARPSILPPAIGVLIVGAWAGLRGGSELIDWLVRTLAHQPTYFGPALPLAAAVCGAVAVLGAVRMMKMKSYGLAVAGSVAVIAAGGALIRPESVVVALAVGIWALAVLLSARAQVGFGLRVEPRRLAAASTPRSQVKGPSVALLALGLFDCVIGTLWLWMRHAWAPTVTDLPEIAVGGAAWVLGLLLIVAALRLMRLKGYRFAFAAGILAMVPLPPFFLVGLPLGIWALVVLRRPEVKAAFAAPGPGAPPPQSPAPDWPARRRVMGPATGLLIVGIFHCLVVAGALILVWLKWPAWPELICCALGFVAAVPVIVGSVTMIRLRSSALARLAAVLAVIPLPNPVAWLLGLPMGIWALRVLAQPEIDAAFAAAAKARKAVPLTPADRVRRPAIGLLVTGILSCLSSPLLLCLGVMSILTEESRQPGFTVAGAIRQHLGVFLLVGGWFVVGLAAAVVVLVGAVKMMRLKSRRWARAGAIVALLPLSHLSLVVGLGMGIWALVVLARPDVKAAFAAAARPRDAAPTRPADRLR